MIRKNIDVVPHKQYFSAQCCHYALGAKFLGKILSPMMKNIVHACYVTFQPAIDLNDSIIITPLFLSPYPKYR